MVMGCASTKKPTGNLFVLNGSWKPIRQEMAEQGNAGGIF
jgi:hypothetical protein